MKSISATLNISKANRNTSILVFVGFFLLLLVTLYELTFGPPYGGPQIQGGVILFFAAIVIILIVTIGFPCAIKLLEKWEVVNYFAFLLALSIVSLGLALISALGLGAIGFGLSFEGLFRSTTVQFLILMIGIFPLSVYWWWIAKKT